jgi:hypothetical protein
LDQHVIDSSFCYGAGGNKSNAKKVKKMPAIYFDQESDYYVWYKCQNITQTVRRIGCLESNNWYIITGLRGTEDFYVFIDNKGNSYTYDLGPTNW